jgi:NitT/TauT family transport system substrate-binding protein
MVRCRALWFCAMFFLFVSCLVNLSPAPAAELKKATFMPQWLPQAQFTGYYVAKEKGIYEKYGIDLTILKGGPDAPACETLAKRKTDFTTTFLSTALQKRDTGVKLVNIGQVVQYSGFMLVAKKASGILSVTDLNGKKVSLWPDFQLQPLAFFRKYGVQAKTIPQASTINLFLRGGVDVVSAMWYNEYHTILSSGLDESELTPFFFDKLGLNFPEDGIYCREETLKRDRALCENFVKASMEGWKYAFDHPDEALDMVMKYVNDANTGTNRVHQKWMLARMKDLILPRENNIPMGRLREQDYYEVAKELQSKGMIKSIVPFSSFYVDCIDGH